MRLKTVVYTVESDKVLLGGDIFVDDGDYEYTETTLEHLVDTYDEYDFDLVPGFFNRPELVIVEIK